MNGSRGAKAFKAPNKLSSVRDAANEQAPAEAQKRPGLKALYSAFGRPVAAPLHKGVALHISGKNFPLRHSFRHLPALAAGSSINFADQSG
jgi:hypothetical protein